MSVVLRCPNCGTVQTTPGECEACHEAQVRYFCTNHRPGIWLSGRTCPQCEAAAPPPVVHARPRPVTVEVPAASVERAEPLRRPLWEKLLRAAVTSATAAPRPERFPGASSWLKRLVLRVIVIAVVLVIALVGALYWLASSLH